MKKNKLQKETVRKDIQGNGKNVRAEKILPYLLLTAGAWLMYGWTYSFHPGLDDVYIYAPLNNVENSFDGLLKVFTLWYSGLDYRPVTMLTFWLQRFALGDIQPGPSHLVNVFIFSLLLMVMYRFILAVRFYPETGKLKMFALLAALLFLLHPNHVSVVANVKSRDNLLSMLFGMMSTIQFLYLFDRRQYWRIVPFLLFLVMAVLSKLDSYIFVFLPVMILFFFRKLEYKKILLFILLSVILYGVVMAVRDNMMGSLLDQKDRLKRLTEGIDFSENPLASQFTFPNRISMACITLLYYLKFMVVPFGYYFYFGYNQIPLHPLLHPVNMLAAGLFLLLGGIAVYRYKTNRTYLFALLFFLLAIAYASNYFIPVAGIVMDRYNFIPSLGFCLVLAAIMVDLSERHDLTLLRNKYVLVVLLFFAGFTVFRTADWRDELVLFEKDIVHLDKSFHANRIIAGTYVNRGLAEEMSPGMDRAVADAYMKKGEFYTRRALAIHDKTPPIWVTSGIIDLYFKRYDSAVVHLHTSLSMDSADVSALNYMGVAYMFKNNFDSAYYYYHQSMEHENTYGYGAKNLMYLLKNYNRPQQADSILHVLYNRFPDNLELKQKMMEVTATGNSILFK